MTPRHHPGLQRPPHDIQVLLHRLPPRLPQLQEDVVVRHRCQDPRLPQPHLPHQLEVLLARANPARDLRIPESLLQTGIYRLLVGLRVEKELARPNPPVGAPQPVQHRVEVNDLLHRERRPRLLPIPEGGVRDPDLLRRIHRHQPMVEGHLRRLVIGKGLPEQSGLGDVLKLVMIGLLLQRIPPSVEGYHVVSSSGTLASRSAYPKPPLLV